MSVVGALIALLGAAGVEIQLAPDQPIPFVYVDEPLIVELKSAEALTTQVHLEIEGEHRAMVPLDFGPLALRDHGVYWQAVEGAPTERGLYRVKTQLSPGGAGPALSFCRIDRPVSGDKSPWGVELTAPDVLTLAAMTALPARSIHLDALAPDAEASATRAASAGFQVNLALDASQAGADATAEALSKKLGDRVSRWEVASSANGDKIGAVAQAIQRGGSRAPIALVTEDAKALETALAAGAGQFVKGVVVRHSAANKVVLKAYRAAAESAGYEALPLIVWEKDGGQRTAADDQQFEHEQVAHLSEGATETEFSGAGLFHDKAFQPAYPHMNALGRQLSGAAYNGELSLDTGITAHVFRVGGAWLIVFWSEAAKETTVHVGDAANLELSDGVNNPLPAPEIKDGAITLTIAPGLSFLHGVGGTTLAQAARRTTHQEAKALSESKSFQKLASKEYVELVKSIAQLEAGKTSRMEYLALLRGFTMLEEQWHAGKASRAGSVAALAALARLSRSLCVLQQESGEPFVEPLRNTLANCGKYQSQYLTGSGGAQGARERGDWLSQEVARLTAEAEGLDKDGRTIEAGAVAAMAEWRARSLESAAKAAPLSKPDPFAHLSPASGDDADDDADDADAKKAEEKKAAAAKAAAAKKAPAPVKKAPVAAPAPVKKK